MDFDTSAFTHRYTFDPDNRIVRDTKFYRDLVPVGPRGGVPVYRLVDEDGGVHRVPVTEVFGAEAAEDVVLDTDFDPADFSDRYNFDFERGVALRLPGKGAKEGPMTLLSPHGWDHYMLTRNDGHRIRVTPAEIRKCQETSEWSVNPPPKSRTFDVFPCHAFTADGAVYRIKSDEPLIRPKKLAPHSTDPFTYRLVSVSGKAHIISKQSIVDLFAK